MNKKYWISVYFNQDVSDDKIKELVNKSYDIVICVFIIVSDIMILPIWNGFN